MNNGFYKSKKIHDENQEHIKLHGATREWFIISSFFGNRVEIVNENIATMGPTTLVDDENNNMTIR
ncbi:hypothetical protein KY314_04035 [Candidatus Woesearchaeota archaeon]|nr:hypothetical protein [Candidatus Woesearchaeota archaeon]